MTPVYAIRRDNGKIAVLGEGRCSVVSCSESGCDFPLCAELTGEEFNTEAEAREKYPNLVLME